MNRHEIASYAQGAIGGAIGSMSMSQSWPNVLRIAFVAAMTVTCALKTHEFTEKAGMHDENRRHNLSDTAHLRQD